MNTTTDTQTTSPTGQPVPSVVVDDVSRRYDDVVAVDHVSLEIGAHEIVALVGPSGCGKSSLLRMLAGLVSTESGSITIGGRTVDDGRRSMPPEHRHVGLVFQEHALFPHLTVAKNVAFGVRTGDETARVAEMLAMLGLAGYGARYPHELSGGERQRVALARALAPRPDVMLLDEPFASLDPNLRAQVRDDVVAVLRASGTPAVFVTHDQAEALAIGDRVAVMRAGRLVQFDSPYAVFHRPADRFVAGFMGEADFLTAADAGHVADERWAVLPPGDVAMIRPADVELHADDQGRARIVGAEFRGSAWNYRVELETGATVHALRSHVEPLDVGARVEVRVASGRPLVSFAG